MNEAVDAVLQCPFDFPIAYLGIFLIVIAHKGRSVGVNFCKIIKALVDACGTFFPSGIIMGCNNAVRSGGCRFGDIITEFDIIQNNFVELVDALEDEKEKQKIAAIAGAAAVAAGVAGVILKKR